MRQATSKGLLALLGAAADTKLAVCRLLNESVCDMSMAKSRDLSPFTVVVYNPMSTRRIAMPVRVPVASLNGKPPGDFHVTDLKAMSTVSSCVVPATAIASPLQELQHQQASAAWELVFQTPMEPFTVQAFRVVPAAPAGHDTSDGDTSSDDSSSAPGPTGNLEESLWSSTSSARGHISRVYEPERQRRRAKAERSGRGTTKQRAHSRIKARVQRRHTASEVPVTTDIENEFLRVSFDGQTGRMVRVVNKAEGVAVEVDQNLHWYESAQAGDADTMCGDGKQKSGAYIFRPNHTSPDGQSATCVSGDCRAKLDVLISPLVSEVQQVFADWATQTVRLYAGAKSVEIEWTVGPVPIDDGMGKEVISRFSTNLTSSGYFLTDSNGRDMLRRRRCSTKEGDIDTECRPSVPKYNVTEPVAGNFYPINSAIVISDELKASASFGVAVDRAQAGASLVDGQVELMVHRRLLCDDNRGVAEPLNETQGISPYDWIDGKGQSHHEPYRIGKGLVVRGKHYLFVSPPSSAARAYRALQDQIYYEPVVAVGDDLAPSRTHSQAGEDGEQEEQPRARRERGGRGTGAHGARLDGAVGSHKSCAGAVDLPENVMILTVEKQPPASPAKRGAKGKKKPLSGPTVLLRLAHRFGVGEDKELSVPASVALADIFCAAHLSSPSSVEELSLSGNQPIAKMLGRKRKWRREASFKPLHKSHLQRGAPEGPGKTISLSPLQIRTFLLHYNS